MVWVRLADDFTDHPKIVAAGPLAGWLWTCGLAYANRYLTDGFIPTAQVRRLADVEDAYGLAARLVDVGLWERAEGGFQIHDYHTYQPTSEDVKRERQAVKDRQAAWRERQRQARAGSAVSNGVTNGVTNGAPYPARPGPVPGPDPAVDPSPQPPPVEGEAPPAPRKRGERPRRGERANGAAHHDEPAEQVELTPVTPGDIAIWNRARAELTAGWIPGNAEKLASVEPIGRGPDGGLHLRAPPWADGPRYRQQVARALLDAGDSAATRVVIVEGYPPGSTEG